MAVEDWLWTLRRLFSSSRELRILLPRVDHGDDLHTIGGNAVDQDIIRMHDRLARAFDAPRPVKQRAFAQTLGAGFDRGV